MKIRVISIENVDVIQIGRLKITDLYRPFHAITAYSTIPPIGFPDHVLQGPPVLWRSRVPPPPGPASIRSSPWILVHSDTRDCQTAGHRRGHWAQGRQYKPTSQPKKNET